MSKSVLVVEDDVEINELLGEYLSLEGLGVLPAFDGQTAISHINTMDATGHVSAPNAPQLCAAILDLMLPDIDGYEICRKINSQRNTAQIPVIILSCMNQDEARRKSLSMGAFRFMSKPFLPDDLIARIKEACTWRKNLESKPPCGQLEISSSNQEALLMGINDMIADLFTHTQLPDDQVTAIRDGFAILTDWALAWGKNHQTDPHLLIQYRLRKSENGDLLNNTNTATNQDTPVIEWLISELEPGLLTEFLLRPQPVVTPGKLPLETKPGLLSSLLRGVVGKDKEKSSTCNCNTPTTSSPNSTSSPTSLTSDSNLLPWQQFLTKINALEYAREPQIRQIKLIRHLGPNPSASMTTNTSTTQPTPQLPPLSIDTNNPTNPICK